MDKMTRHYASCRSGDSVLVTSSLSPNRWARINFLAQAIVSPKNRQAKYYEILSRVESQSGEDTGQDHEKPLWNKGSAQVRITPKV